MSEFFIERHRGGERAILVQMNTGENAFEEDLAEFQALADAAAVKTLAVARHTMAIEALAYLIEA